MREENIKQAVSFLQKKDANNKDIPMEEKLKFLEGKLTEEELGEVRKRMSEVTSNPVVSKGSVTKDSVMQNVK
jgi:hypothetical protein